MIVDMHCHVIWGVDDGARNPDDMRAMLRQAAENRVSHIVCTSHITPGEVRFPEEEYRERLAEGQAFCDAEGLGLTLHPGSEILYTDHTPRMLREKRVPRLNDKWAVLAEFWYEVPFRKLCEAAEALADEGMTVIFAHVERYKALHAFRDAEALARDYGVLMQMNARTVYTKQGFLTERWKRKMLSEGLISMVASDAHNTGERACNMLKAREALARDYGEDTAEALCGGNAARILEL